MPFMGSVIARRRMSSGEGPTEDGYGLRPIIGRKDWYAPRTSESIMSLSDPQNGNYEAWYASHPLQYPNGGTAPFDANGNFFIPPFTVTGLDGNEGMWIAYPKVYGKRTFQELDSNYNDYPFGASLEGANGDPTDPSKFGPKEVIVTINGVNYPFWLYMNDWPGMGTLHYRAY